MGKTKIVLDADVLIHFINGGYLGLLPEIFTTYKHIILSKVYYEITNKEMKKQLDNQISRLKNIEVVEFNPTGEMLKEYAILTSSSKEGCKSLGSGESASLAYCRFNNDVIGSSNLSDIIEYCKKHDITYLTTFDFLYHAVNKKKMTMEEAIAFVDDVITKGSKLPPSRDFKTYVSSVII